MSRPFRPSNAKFVDCRQHGPGSGAELILVEGDSALNSVLTVRNEQHQAVLALQGKPLNAWVASPAKVAAHVQYQLLAQALGLTSAVAGAGGEMPSPPKFERLVLLFDPDADGIHIGALLVLFVKRWLPGLLETRQLWQVRAPMFELVAADSGQVHQADNPVACQALALRLTDAAGGIKPQIQAYRGLGSLSQAVLRSQCVDPNTRQAYAVGPADVQAVVEVFGGRKL